MLRFLKKIFLKKNAGQYEAYKKQGNLCLGGGDLSGAENFYKKMIVICPDVADGYVNLSFVFFEKKQYSDAESYIRKAICIDNKNPDSYYILGKILQFNKLNEEAIDAFNKSLLYCSSSELYLNLSSVFFEAQQAEVAIKCLYSAKKIDPNNNSIQYLIDAIDGKNRPDTPPRHYVELLFNNYAEDFDRNLINDLGYNAPEQLCLLLEDNLNVTGKKYDILDLGCGTGLVGMKMMCYANQLVGVDLASNMIEKSKERGVYTRLEHSDLIPMMQNEVNASYDIVVAADVFIYVGRLDTVFFEVKRLLRKGGVFLFSAEAFEAVLDIDKNKESQQNFRLNATGRYAHSEQYIRELSGKNEMAVKKIHYAPIRKNLGVPVMGWYVLCQLAV